jgi:hypothetical protein
MVSVIDDAALLDEVTASSVRRCLSRAFERISGRQECLILTMKANQKYSSAAGRGRQADPPSFGCQQHQP